LSSCVMFVTLSIRRYLLYVRTTNRHPDGDRGLRAAGTEPGQLPENAARRSLSGPGVCENLHGETCCTLGAMLCSRVSQSVVGRGHSAVLVKKAVTMY
jgi:hypothetical protein